MYQINLTTDEVILLHHLTNQNFEDNLEDEFLDNLAVDVGETRDSLTNKLSKLSWTMHEQTFTRRNK